MLLSAQLLAERLCFPSAFGRRYRDVVHHCTAFTMEELASFIWYGGAVAECGPSVFKQLWGHLQPALWHYMYNRGATELQMREGHASLLAYAQQLELLVIQRKVCCSLRTLVCGRGMGVFRGFVRVYLCSTYLYYMVSVVSVRQRLWPWNLRPFWRA